MHWQTVSLIFYKYKIFIFQDFEITIDVVSGKNVFNNWKQINLSGQYHLTEILNDRPAYKVSFDIQK